MIFDTCIVMICTFANTFLVLLTFATAKFLRPPPQEVQHRFDFKDTYAQYKFRESKLVPDIMHDPPKSYLRISYGPKRVFLGNTLTITETRGQPMLVNWEFRRNKLYTLMMLDPDALCRDNPQFRSVLHWLVGNILGNDIENGDSKASYRGPGPPPGTGLHRYVQLVFEHPTASKIAYPEYKDAQSRLNFNLIKFVLDHNLPIQPLAGNFFYTENATPPTSATQCNTTTHQKI